MRQVVEARAAFAGHEHKRAVRAKACNPNGAAAGKNGLQPQRQQSVPEDVLGRGPRREFRGAVGAHGGQCHADARFRVFVEQGSS